MFRHANRIPIVVAIGVLACAAHDAGRAGFDPVPVRHAEGTVHGFLSLSTADGAPLASGDLLQVVRDGSIDSRMIFHFADSSYFEEAVTFTQEGVFAMQSYHLVQRGPTFDADLDATLDANGHYRVRSTSHEDGKRQEWDDTLDLPPDVSNGLPVIFLKNLGPGEARTVHMVAFTPEPRLIGLELSPVGEGRVLNGQREETMVEYALKPQLGVLTGFFAKLLGKMPADSHVWIVTDDVPTFVRSEGPLYMGPVWRIDLARPEWPG